MRLAFTVRRPVSLNHAYATAANGKRVLTTVARDYKHHVGWTAKVAALMNEWQPSPAYTLTIRIWFASKRRADIDNTVKLTADAIAETLGFDDRLIQRIVIERAGIDKVDPRGEIVLEDWTV